MFVVGFGEAMGDGGDASSDGLFQEDVHFLFFEELEDNTSVLEAGIPGERRSSEVVDRIKVVGLETLFSVLLKDTIKEEDVRRDVESAKVFKGGEAKGAPNILHVSEVFIRARRVREIVVEGCLRRKGGLAEGAEGGKVGIGIDAFAEKEGELIWINGAVLMT